MGTRDREPRASALGWYETGPWPESEGAFLPKWTTIATNTPVSIPWTVTDTNVMATVTQRFYRAFNLVVPVTNPVTYHEPARL
jgi:hypothetical protein